MFSMIKCAKTASTEATGCSPFTAVHFMRLMLVLLCAVLSVSAQSTGGAALRGTVLDSTGAAIAGVKLTATNIGTSFVYEGITSQDGSYYISYLLPGDYRLTVEASGFKKHVRDGITLRTAETPRIDVQLEVGNVTESVTITGAPPLIETETAATGQIIEGNTVIKLPVMQKYVHRVILYMPDVSTINASTHINGQNEDAIGYQMDGVNGKAPPYGNFGQYRDMMIASLDSIQEFKVWSSGLPAEFGHAAGGLMTVSFRSGVNQFHGSLEDRYTNGVLMHRHYFEPLVRDGPFSQHDWGPTASGPIKRNKTFFFVGYQQHLEKLLEGFIGDVPSAQMLEGNFDFGPGTYPIYNPFTTRQNAQGTWISDPFPGNRVPLSMFDPVAKNVLALKPWREPNATGIVTPSGPQQNLSFSAPGAYDFQRFDIKTDHQFSATHKMFGRYSQVRHRSEDRPVRQINPEARFQLWGNPYIQPADNRNVVISDTFTLSSSAVNEFRAGYNRRHLTNKPESIHQNWAGKLGIPNVADDTFPNFNLYALNPGGMSQQVGEDFTVAENFTKSFSGHIVKTGYEMVRTRYNQFDATMPSGNYSMGGTSLPFTPNTGNTFASFLLGTVTSATFTRTNATFLPRWWQHALYIQDSWKARRDLTIEMGVRWSYQSPFSTKFGQQTRFDPTVTDGLTGRKGAVTHPQGLLSARNWINFQPRLGLAWNLKPKLVYRANFGISSSDVFGNGNFEEYATTAVIQGPPGDPRYQFLLSKGPGAIVYPPQNADGSVPFVGTNYSGRNVSFLDGNLKTPYIMNWSSGFQYQLPRDLMVEFKYSGSAGVKLINAANINQIPFDISKDLVVLDQISRATQNYRPFTQFGSINFQSNFGHNTYHGGTLRVEKRTSAGFMMNAFYTYSKTINGGVGVNYYNRSLDKGRADYDIQHRFVSVLTYELPWGKGRRFMNSGGWRNYMFGGWDLAWTQTLQSGPPVTVTYGGSPYRYLGGNRPNMVVPNEQGQVSNWEIGPNRYPFSAQNRYFNFDAFRYPSAFTLGTLGRNTFEAPGMRWQQLSLSKQFIVRERLKFEIRWDCNNVTKEPQFAAPNAAYNITSPANFGTFSGTRGSFSDAGTARFHHIIVGRFQF